MSIASRDENPQRLTVRLADDEHIRCACALLFGRLYPRSFGRARAEPRRCIRGASGSDAWQYLFWRALGFGLVLSLVAAQRHATSPLVRIRRLGGLAWVSVLAMVTSQVCFVAAIKSGSTAEVFFLMSSLPGPSSVSASAR